MALYVAAGTVAGAGAGALLGFAGSQVHGTTRAVLASVVAFLAAGIALAGLSGHRVPVIQVDAETPFRWLEGSPVTWAVRNGSALGLGIGSRLGYWSWYVIPIGAFLGADSALGASGYGIYACVRTAGVMGLLYISRATPMTGNQILDLTGRARAILNLQLLLIAMLTLFLFEG